MWGTRLALGEKVSFDPLYGGFSIIHRTRYERMAVELTSRLDSDSDAGMEARNGEIPNGWLLSSVISFQVD